MAKARPDLVVIGGGSAGLGAAFAARFRGKRVTIVQDGPIGGDCTFTGCVPSKALLAAASKGLSFGDAMGRVRQAVEAVAYEERAEVLRGRGIDVIEGSARMRGGGRVEVDGSEVAADRLVIAAGSAPAVPPIPGLAEAGCLTSDDLFALEQRPARLVIIGGGPIGCEMAQAFSLFGTEVVLIEGAERLLPRDDADASRAIHTSLTRRGVRVVLGVAVDRVTAIESNTVEVKAGAERFIADQLLVATGRAPALDSLDPEAGGVELTDRGWVKVDDHLATTAEGVYAAGDVVGSVQLTHAAAAMASVAVDNALGSGMARFRRRRWLPETIPWVTFTTPEVGQIGLTEAQAAGVKGARVSELAMGSVDRAVAVDATEGFIKLIAGPRPVTRSLGGGRLLGATVVGERAGELLGELTLMASTAMFVGRLAQVPHAYPTWSSALGQAASQFFTDAVTGATARSPRAG